MKKLLIAGLLISACATSEIPEETSVITRHDMGPVGPFHAMDTPAGVRFKYPVIRGPYRTGLSEDLAHRTAAGIAALRNPPSVKIGGVSAKVSHVRMGPRNIVVANKSLLGHWSFRYPHINREVVPDIERLTQCLAPRTNKDGDRRWARQTLTIALRCGR